jgi:hypothetical protein
MCSADLESTSPETDPATTKLLNAQEEAREQPQLDWRHKPIFHYTINTLSAY